MKLTIKSDRPLGRDELAKVVRAVVKDDHLHKSAEDQDPREMELPALQGAIDQNKPTVEKIRLRMVEKLERVLKGA